MARYVLTLRARADLLAIYAFTEATFGRYQADAYHSGLERTFELISDFPAIGTSADELIVGYRRFRFQSHYIFYTSEADFLLIRALIHVRQELRPGLFA